MRVNCAAVSEETSAGRGRLRRPLRLAILLSCLIGLSTGVHAQDWYNRLPAPLFPSPGSQNPPAWQNPPAPRIPPPSQDPRRNNLSLQAFSGFVRTIGGVTTEGRDCEAILPKLELEEPPEHGVVCFRIEELARRDAAYSDSPPNPGCTNRSLTGVRILYVNKAGYVGNDRLRYRIVATPSIIRNVSLDIQHWTGTQPGAETADTAGIKIETPQPRGPIPPCSPPIS